MLVLVVDLVKLVAPYTTSPFRLDPALVTVNATEVELGFAPPATVVSVASESVIVPAQNTVVAFVTVL